MATYSEKLQDIRWQKKRLSILNRDNWQCRKCPVPSKFLHVHHKQYEYGRDPWAYEDENFLSLCPSCHKKEHRPQVINEVIGELIKPPEVIMLMDEHINSLQVKLREKIPDELQEDILKNIMFLTNKKKELLQR